MLRDHRALGDQIGSLDRLAPPDRARAQALATATLRHLGRIDAFLDHFLTRRPPAPALDALRLATTELRVHGIPPHAAVDAAVRLVSAGKNRTLAGLVNAVARRVADAAELWEATPEAPLADWLARPIAAAWGKAAAERIALVSRQPSPVDLTLRDPSTASALAAELGATLLPTGSLRLATPGQVSALPGFDAGAWWVQDAAAALPMRLLPDVAGRRVLDLCAAPGGKSLQLAAAGAEVTSLDISEARLGRLRDNLARTQLAAELVAADALAWTPDAPYDAILLDAPCSASGTLRRHPDLAYLPRDLAPLITLQDALLDRAWGWLAPGGHLVFCTCSLFPAEGEERIARFLAGHPEATVLPADPARLGVEPAWIDASGALRTRPDFWPGEGGVDGFYAACITAPS
ncbi:16S rRNA (cytosine967-C5)-methyltransferase [Amaricoccus macauensis]|uniref:16S rRNA (Cytosine967-C5)-methyltransferase n=1 Tax=Amaricoccus macauensis TaxID=57001 RepID=A0A840SJQ8_9RHOB|nr:16S rRNA (cytosine967-C5)-methyltransferase [Amaricoccus macauensis]